MSKTHAFIFVRGGSKGLPRKNVLSIGGQPLFTHGINLARELKEVDRIYVSTDCDEISEIAKTYEAEVIERPAKLASDTASEWLAWQHAIRFVQKHDGLFDRFVSLPATAPLRKPQDVKKCFAALIPGIDIVITMSKSHRSPWFNMVDYDSNGHLKLVGANEGIHRRQDSQTCFDVTTVAYVARPKFILQTSCIWDGNVAGVEVPKERSIDIDDSFDFAIARFLMEQCN